MHDGSRRERRIQSGQGGCGYGGGGASYTRRFCTISHDCHQLCLDDREVRRTGHRSPIAIAGAIAGAVTIPRCCRTSGLTTEASAAAFTELAALAAATLPSTTLPSTFHAIAAAVTQLAALAAATIPSISAVTAAVPATTAAVTELEAPAISISRGIADRIAIPRAISIPRRVLLAALATIAIARAHEAIAIATNDLSVAADRAGQYGDSHDNGIDGRLGRRC